MTETFETVPAPTRSGAGRKPLPNPFMEPGVFPTGLYEDGTPEARSVICVEGKTSTQARRLIRQARQAAKTMGLTARVAMNEGTASGGVPLPEGACQLLFWTVPRHARKEL